MSDFEQDWYEEVADPFAPLRNRGVMPSNNEKIFDGDADLVHNDKVDQSISERSDNGQPNKPSKNYDDNMPYEGYKSGRL